ncbi:MAG: hypothetical protein JRE23_12870 [Deltaproteobacteria bacterium]|nr:hypothetical protein [Deltaproteobacteria bacterium]
MNSNRVSLFHEKLTFSYLTGKTSWADATDAKSKNAINAMTKLSVFISALLKIEGRARTALTLFLWLIYY